MQFCWHRITRWWWCSVAAWRSDFRTRKMKIESAWRQNRQTVTVSFWAGCLQLKHYSWCSPADMDRIQWRVRTITMTSDPLPAQPSPELANHRPVSRSRDLSRPIAAQYCRYKTVAGIWDRYTIIHWKRPEPFFSQTRLLGQFSGLPAVKIKPDPDGSAQRDLWSVYFYLIYFGRAGKSLLSHPLPTERSDLYIVYYFLDK